MRNPEDPPIYENRLKQKRYPNMVGFVDASFSRMNRKSRSVTPNGSILGASHYALTYYFNRSSEYTDQFKDSIVKQNF
jgi:hypothetical protein